ncbi:MAG: hypothetical protein ACETWK_14480 [Candidatus Aminicenantaceae bacterium]
MGKKLTVPITSSRALQIALEDTKTSYFIMSNFSQPEQNPEVSSNRWISKSNRGYSWKIEIIEKTKNSHKDKGDMANIALIEVDSKSGRVIKRYYLRNILMSEYQKFLKKNEES